MITLTAAAHCGSCDWTATGDPGDVDKSAEKHVKNAGHPVGTVATPTIRRPS